jgi:hypothetical protein
VREVKQQASRQHLLRCYGLKLAKVAVSVLHMPPTSEATERNFSTYSTVHTARQKKEELKKDLAVSEMRTKYMHNFVLFYYILFIIFPTTCFGELPSSGRIHHFYYIKHLKD